MLLQSIVGQHYLLTSVRDGPVYSVLKEIRKEALKRLSLAFGALKRLLSWAAFWILPGHFTPFGTFLRKEDYKTAIQVSRGPRG